MLLRNWLQPDRQPDALTDLYALGATLYQMLSGRPPFAGYDPASKLARHAAEPLAPLEPFGVPQPLAQLIGRLLAKDRAARFQTALELAESLGSLVDPGVLESTPQPAPTALAYDQWLERQSRVPGAPAGSIPTGSQVRAYIANEYAAQLAAQQIAAQQQQAASPAIPPPPPPLQAPAVIEPPPAVPVAAAWGDFLNEPRVSAAPDAASGEPWQTVGPSRSAGYDESPAFATNAGATIATALDPSGPRQEVEPIRRSKPAPRAKKNSAPLAIVGAGLGVLLVIAGVAILRSLGNGNLPPDNKSVATSGSAKKKQTTPPDFWLKNHRNSRRRKRRTIHQNRRTLQNRKAARRRRKRRSKWFPTMAVRYGIRRPPASHCRSTMSRREHN